VFFTTYFLWQKFAKKKNKNSTKKSDFGGFQFPIPKSDDQKINIITIINIIL
jgi:hypothetical protein